MSIVPRPARDGHVRFTRRSTRKGQRIWFSCVRCGAYGKCVGSVWATEAVLDVVITDHFDRHREGSRAADLEVRAHAPTPVERGDS